MFRGMIWKWVAEHLWQTRRKKYVNNADKGGTLRKSKECGWQVKITGEGLAVER